MTSIRRNLAQYLLKINTFEIMAEKIRQKIAENPYFQVETVFQRLDYFHKGYLIPEDLSEFMLQNKIYPTEAELYLIFRGFDSQRKGTLALSNLSKELLPKQNDKLTKKALDRKYYNCGLQLEIDLQFTLARYFEHKISEIKQLARMRLQMFEKQTLTVEESFTLLDCEKKGQISSLNQIDRFLRNNGKVATKDELLRIFRVLTFDNNSTILYQTFQENLDPLGKGYYVGYAQRVAEKQQKQQDFIRQKLAVNSQLAHSSRIKLALTDSIYHLDQQNQRLANAIQLQSEQRRAYEEQLLSCRIRRNLY